MLPHAIATKLYGTVSVKSSAAVLGAGVSFLVGEISTGSLYVSAIAALIGAPVAAAIAVVPKIITAKKDANASASITLRAEMAQLVAELDKNHSADILALRCRVAEQNRERMLMRQSKHNMIDEIYRLTLHVITLDFELRQARSRGADIPILPPFEAASIKKLLEEEDREMMKLTAEAVNFRRSPEYTQQATQ